MRTCAAAWSSSLVDEVDQRGFVVALELLGEVRRLLDHDVPREVKHVPGQLQHDAFNDALMSAMMYVALRDLKERGVRVARPRTGRAIFNPTGG